MTLTEDQITQLAPDAASVKAGQQLATNSKWVVKQVHEKAMWGDCQGSGKNPYRTMVDLQQIAFKCSCPSRKFPCKHGLGLLYLYVRNPSVFTKASALDTQVEEWVEKRGARSTEKKEKQENKPVDTKAQEKRAEEREKKVSAGMEELRAWIKDLVRNGIAHVPAEAYKFTATIAARMVDAQAPGTANALRRLSELNYYQEGWQKPFLRQLSQLYLLTEAYKNSSHLPEALQTDIRTLIGWNTSKEQVLQQEAMPDDWAVLAKTYETEERLTVERVWLYGYNNSRFALLLNFYAAGQVPEQTMLAGTSITADLAFYPATIPLRALIKQQQSVQPIDLPAASTTLAALAEHTANTLAQAPFTGQLPFLLQQVRILFQNNTWFLADDQHEAQPLRNAGTDGWRTLGISGGEAITAFVVAEPEGLLLLSFWHADTFYSLT